MSGVIIEGVTGAGKTSTIKALASIAAFDLVNEETTFNDFMTKFFSDPDAASREACDRLAAILDKLENGAARDRYVLERFHFSQLALGSGWKWYHGIDQRCAALGCKVVVLVIPDKQLTSRSLYRVEYDGADWQTFIGYYGSEEKALGAIRHSQQARLDAIKESRLEHCIIDTNASDWGTYATTIARWVHWA